MKQEIVNKFLLELDLFIESNFQNKWIYLNELKIYVRQSKRYYNGEVLDCIDLATIEVYEKGTGLFTVLLKAILKKYENIYIESILNKRFYNFLLRKGFQKYKKYINDGCLIRTK